jgi:hypothetical protein
MLEYKKSKQIIQYKYYQSLNAGIKIYHWGNLLSKKGFKLVDLRALFAESA